MLNRPGITKQLIIQSGKGGTGNTSLSAAFAYLQCSTDSRRPAVLVDTDVDAANLNLVLQPDQYEPHDFWGGSLAEIDGDKYNGCGACIPMCRYDAIFPVIGNNNIYQIDSIKKIIRNLEISKWKRSFKLKN